MVFLVVGEGRWKGADHNDPNVVMWEHPSLNLLTGERFKTHEWSNESWEGRSYIQRIA